MSTELARFSKFELIYKVRCSILLRFSYASIFLSLNCLLYEIYAMDSFSFQAFFSCCARRRIELATTGGYKKNSKKICSRTQCSIVCAKNVTCWTLNADRRLRTTKPQSTCNYANLHAITRTVVWTPECIMKSAEKLPSIIEDLDSSNNMQQQQQCMHHYFHNYAK